jgi:hypothetical protein
MGEEERAVGIPIGISSLTPYAARIFAPDWRGRYPRLAPADARVWRKFQDRYWDGFLGFQYDIPLGEGALAIAGSSSVDVKLLYDLTVKRADVLAISAQVLWCIEVKPRLGMAAIGQLVVYRELWRRQWHGGIPVEFVWVGEQSEPDLEYVAGRVGLRLVVV